MAQLIGRRRPAAASSEGKGNRSASPSMTGVPCRHRDTMGLRPAPAAPSSRLSKGNGNRITSPSRTGVPGRHRDTMGLRPALVAPSSRPLKGKGNCSALPSITGVPGRHLDPTGLRPAAAAPSSRPSKGKGNRSALPSMTGVPRRHLDPTGLRPAAAATSSRPSKGKGNCSASPAMTGVSGRHCEPMVAAVAPCTDSCPKGVSTISVFDHIRRLEQEEMKVVQLEMLKSKYETPAYLEEIIAFVNTLLVAHQYFDFKEYLRTFCGLDKYDFTDSATSYTLTALPEQLNMFDKLSVQDIGSAVNAHTFEMRDIVFDNSEGRHRTEEDDTYAFSNPIFVSALQARKGDRVMHEHPEVELQNVKNSIKYFQDYYFCREPELESSETETVAKKVENVTDKLTEACRKYYFISCYCESLSEAMNGAKGSGIPATDANDKAAKGLHGENVLDIGQMV